MNWEYIVKPNKQSIRAIVFWRKYYILLRNFVFQLREDFDSGADVTLTDEVLFIINVTPIIIITTRPKPAYGWQGLAESWGQDTYQAGTFWGVFNVSLRASVAQKKGHFCGQNYRSK